jgi:hypothetical protein
VGLVPIGVHHIQRLGTDFQRFSSAIDMVVVVGCFDERAGQQGIIASPGTGSLGR